MRILSIRGANLASLPRFQVRFSEEPLSRAGLVLLCGPTGVGKSTLLDAMCLALYDKIPRLLGSDFEKGLRVGLKEDGGQDLRLSPTDPRSLLRRGAASAYAQVDFAVQGKGRYQATWRVRRARNQSEGRVQEQRLELRSLDSGAVLSSDRKTETLKQIEELVGLSFAQFCRSVLLAQGEFAQFLRLRGDERADLLERMTQTGVYGQLSQAAYARARAEGARLLQLQQERAAQQLFTDAERGAAEQRAAALQAERRGRQAEVEALRQAERLFSERERLAQEIVAREATEAHTAAASAAAGAAERQAEQQAAAARAEEAAAQPELLVARELDVALQHGVAQQRERERQHHQAQEAAAAARRRREALSEQAQQKQREQEAQRRWLDDHQRVQPLLSARAEWLDALTAYRELVLQGGKQQQRRARLLEKRDAEQRRWEQLFKHQKPLQQQLDEQAAALHKLRERMQAFRAQHPPERLRALRDEATAALQRLEQLQEAHRQAQKDAQREEELQARLAHHEQAAQDKQAERARRAERLRGLEAALAQLQRDLHIAREAERLAARRPELLQDGHPCPLCGSLEHPAARQAPPWGAAVTRLSAELRAAEEQLAGERARHQEADKALHAHEKLREQLTHDLRKAAEERAEREREFARVAALLPGGGAALVKAGPRQAAVTGLCAELQRRYGAQREEAQRRDDEGAALQQQIEEGAARLEQLRQQLAQTQEALGESRAALQEAEQQLTGLSELLAQNQAALQRQADLLRAPLRGFGDFAARLREDAAGFLRALDEEVAEYARRARVLEELVQKEPELQAQAALAEQECARLADLVQREGLALREAQELLQRKRAERQARLSGQPVAAVEAALRRRVQEEEERRMAQQGARTRAEALHQAAVEALRGARERRRALSEGPVDAAVGERVARLPSLEAVRAALTQEEEALLQVVGDQAALQGRLDEDRDLRERTRALLPAIEAQGLVVERWQEVERLIGSADGKRFRRFAQGLTLDALLAHANQHLARLRPRYRLERVPGYDMDLQIIDRDMGDEVRSCATLSGGETFLCSLALALGLSSLASRSVTLESLFIDEGFGTLDAETLEVALELLDELHHQGRQVTVISHVPELVERIAHRVVLEPRPPGSSRVMVMEGDRVAYGSGGSGGPDDDDGDAGDEPSLLISAKPSGSTPKSLLRSTAGRSAASGRTPRLDPPA